MANTATCTSAIAFIKSLVSDPERSRGVHDTSRFDRATRQFIHREIREAFFDGEDNYQALLHFGVYSDIDAGWLEFQRIGYFETTEA